MRPNTTASAAIPAEAAQTLAHRLGSTLPPMATLSEFEALIARLATIDFSQSSEQATREMAVNPVIAALGWDTFNPDEVAREYSVRGGRVDYCLRGPTGNLVLIEVKRTGTDLSSHQEQLLRYAFEEGAPLAALTDGLVWWLYLPMAGGGWEQRRFFRIDFREQPPASTTLAITRFLSRDALVSGDALTEAHKEFESQKRDRLVRAALRDAWVQILKDHEGLLPVLLSDAVVEISGHAPSREMVIDFLDAIAGSDRTEVAPPSSPKPPKRPTPAPPTKQPGSSPATRPPVAEPPTPAKKRKFSASIPPSALWLDGERHEVKNWRSVLVAVCELLAKESGPSFAEQIVSLRGRKRPYFSSSRAELRDPIQIPGTGLYVEANQSADSAERLARLALRTIRDSDEGFRVETAKQDRRERKPPSS